MEIRFIVFDKQGLSSGTIPLPDKSIAITIVDGDREITYDPESYDVALSKGDATVRDFSDDLVPVDV